MTNVLRLRVQCVYVSSASSVFLWDMFNIALPLNHTAVLST